MARGALRGNNLTKETLLTIAKGVGVGAAVVVAATSPYFLSGLARNFFDDVVDRAVRARARKLRELERRRLVSFKELPSGDVRIELMHRGKLLVRQYQLETMKLARPARWDRTWRIVMYDIPQGQRQASNAFREKLRQLGLFPLQRSVWVSPYECIGELEFLCSVFEINMDNHVCHFTAEHIPKEKEAKKFFNL